MTATKTSTATEDILQHKPRPSRYLFIWKNVGTQGQHLLNTTKIQMLDQEPDVIGITTPSGEDLHRQEVLRRRRRYPQTRIVEHPGSIWIPTGRDIGTRLLVQPPPWQAKLAGDSPRFLKYDSVWLEHRINIAGCSPRVIRQGHSRTAKDVDVRDQTAPCQPIAQFAECTFNSFPVKKRITNGHATSNSWAATYTPRLRNAAGACTTASTRAARVLNGNQNRRSERDADQSGAARPSRAERCSASAARNTSQCSSPTLAGSAASNSCRADAGSHRYSSRNSAIMRHLRGSSAPVSKLARSAKVIARYPAPCSSTPMTLVHSGRRVLAPRTRGSGTELGVNDILTGGEVVDFFIT